MGLRSILCEPWAYSRADPWPAARFDHAAAFRSLGWATMGLNLMHIFGFTPCRKVRTQGRRLDQRPFSPSSAAPVKPGRACPNLPVSQRRLGLSSCGRRRTPRICAPLGRACLTGEIQSAIDQTYMTVGLRKISEQAAGNRIELFGKQ